MNKRPVLLVAILVSFLTPFMGNSLNVSLPVIASDFAMDTVLLSWVNTSYFLASAIFLVPFGRLADMYGRRKFLTYGILIYVISCILSAVSTSSIEFISFRVLQGIGSAMIYGTSLAILSSVYYGRERGKALGINVTATYSGGSLGPVLGGFLTQYYGWRSVFLFSVPFGLIIITLLSWKMEGEWVGAKGETFDSAGSIIYSLTLIACMCGLSLLPEMCGAWLILVGALGILTFIKWEMKVKNPILDMNLFKKNIVFTLSNLAALIHYSSTFAVSFLLSLYLQYMRRLTPQDSGLILVSQSIVMAVFSPFAGRLSDRMEPRKVASVGMSITCIGILLFSFLDEKTTLIYIVACLILLGFGFAFFSSPNTYAVMNSVEGRYYGIASGMLGTMRLIGNMLSMGIVMLIFSTYIGRVQITPEYFPLLLKSVKVAFFIFAILCFGGIFASFTRGKITNDRSVGS